MKIVLVGNPNVGKSAFFSRLTGVNVIISNYPGTTFEFIEGSMNLNGKSTKIIDVPGIYNLDPNCKADEAAIKIIEEADLIINIVDSTNLERNLYLTLQIMEKNIPMVIALNFWDETKHKGIKIDPQKIEELIGLPAIPTVSITGEGIKNIVTKLSHAKTHSHKYSEDEKWAKIGEIVQNAQKIEHKKHSFLELCEDLSIKPLTGLPIALLVIALIFWFVRFIGEGTIKYVVEPLFSLLEPLMLFFSNLLGPGILNDILIGPLIDGRIDYSGSMGVLTTGLFVPFAMIGPYIISFYIVLGILEDSGYLPRLAALVDNLTHKLGMHGIAIIPMLLSLGCKVPGVLATRILETKRQRFIATTLMIIAMPCMGQMAMVFGMLGKFGIKGLGIFFASLFIFWAILGLMLHKIMKGKTPETFSEIPPYRVPFSRSILKKTWLRTRSFMLNAIPFIALGVLLINILHILGVVAFVGRLLEPVVSTLFGLPKETVGALIMGFFRKDVAAGMLMPLQLTMNQLVTVNVILTMYFPCLATFSILFKEMGFKDSLKSITIMVLSTIIAGTSLNLLLNFF